MITTDWHRNLHFLESLLVIYTKAAIIAAFVVYPSQLKAPFWAILIGVIKVFDDLRVIGSVKNMTVHLRNSVAFSTVFKQHSNTFCSSWYTIQSV